MGIRDITAPSAVRAQYAGTGNLTTRMAIWHPTADGRDPKAECLAAIVDEQPTRYLEVGCGTGAFAESVAQALPGCEVIATDASHAMVEASANRGLTVRLADITALPLEDASFDVVAALWMLYHVPDLPAALREVRRVLRSGGLFLVATNSDRHLADLKEWAGLPIDPLPFSAENGPDLLRECFDHVECEVLRTRAIFPDRDALDAYLASMGLTPRRPIESFTQPRTFHGGVAIMRCR